jgi:hypothetical protein
LTFARNSNATRVNSAGLIEKVRTNEILQSEDFTTTWGATSVSVTANTTANPLNGALTADTITLSAGTTQKFLAQDFIFSGNFTTSVYLKAGTQQFLQLMLGTDSTPFANFDLVNGTASATGSTASIVAVGNGWYRCSMSFTSVIGTNVFITAADSLATPRFQPTASTGTYIAFGYQLETNDIATPYIPTTTAAVSVGITADIPRLDYTGGGCPSLLLEPQRANLFTFSEQFNNADWYAIASPTITANVAVAPDGTMSADQINRNAGGSINQDKSVTSGVNHTISCFIKKSTSGNSFAFVFTGDGYSSNVSVAIYNFDTKAISITAGVGVVANAVEYSNGWVRFSMTSPASSTNTATFRLVPGDDNWTTLLWGAQLEVGSYVSSYIPTLGLSVTRLADTASKTGISSLIGQTEGTLFIETTYNGAVNTGLFNRLITISNGVDNNFISVSKNASTTELYVYAQTAAGVQVNSNPIANTNLVGTHKIALAYKANDYVLYVDGVQRFTDTLAEVPACSQLNIGNIPFFSGGDELGGGVNQALLFTNRLTNAELATLTSL